MTDNQSPGPFVPPSVPGCTRPAADGQLAGYPPQAGSQPGYGAYEPPGQYPQPGQWNQQPPVPYGAYPVQHPRQRTGMLVGGIILAVWGGMAILGQLSMAANGGIASSPSGPGYMVGRLGGLLVFAVGPLVGGIMMIVRSKRR